MTTSRSSRRTATFNAAADGTRDFTVSVNDGPEILYVNVGGADPGPGSVIGHLHIDGLAGDDDIILRAPADNGAGWSMRVEVAGGAPSDGADNEGDRLVLETPGHRHRVLHARQRSDTGTILIDENANATFEVGDTQIVIGPIVMADPPINYNSTQPPGIELFEYDGEGGNDTFYIVGTAGDDTITHTPGAAIDEGTLRVNTRLGVNYQNLGAGAVVRVDGAGNASAIGDTLIAQGTPGRDIFTVDRVSALIGRIRFNGHVPLQTTNALATANTVERYQIDTLDGDDLVTIQLPLATGVAGVAVNAGGPAGTDVLEILGDGAANVFEALPAWEIGAATVTVDALTVDYTGVEHLQLDAGDDVGDSLDRAGEQSAAGRQPLDGQRGIGTATACRSTPASPSTSGASMPSA